MKGRVSPGGIGYIPYHAPGNADLIAREVKCRVCGKTLITFCRTKSNTHPGDCAKEIARLQSAEYYERKRKEKAQKT